MATFRAVPRQATSADRSGYPLGPVGLHSLMEVGSGSADVIVGLIDGPVAVDHPALAGARFRPAHGIAGACTRAQLSCAHGTFVAGILAAHRGSAAAGICPECTILVRPIFMDSASDPYDMPRATAAGMAQAMRECIDGGARLLNLSVALQRSDAEGERRLTETLDLASRRGVIIVVAAGNEGQVGSSALTRHRWVVPVVAFARNGRPLTGTNLGRSIGQNGLGAPGERVVSLTPGGGTVALSGTSAATPFVTGAAALLWSKFPRASAASIRLALTRPPSRAARQAAPPLMDAWGAYRRLAGWYERSDRSVGTRT
jgi:subtilisin family serine protease